MFHDQRKAVGDLQHEWDPMSGRRALSDINPGLFSASDSGDSNLF